jgi:hypothetical protein
LSSDVEDTKPLDTNASEALQKYREIVRVLVERPPGQRLPPEAKPDEAKPERKSWWARPSSEGPQSLEELGQYDLLVGKYAGLLPVLELSSNAAFGETALLGALALQAGRTRVAAHIYEEVNFGTSNVTAFSVCVAGGLGFPGCLNSSLHHVWSYIRFGLHEPDLPYLFTMQSFTSLANVLIGTLFGCFGGVVSLLLRLPDFEIVKGKSRTFLRGSGTTQPIIGGIFAFVLGAIISAKIINISVGGSSDLSPWLFVVLGFLAGFSERFTKNLLHVAESHFGGATGPTPQPPQQGS